MNNLWRCALLVFAAFAAHAGDRTWHVLIVTWEGKVTLMKGLTESEAKKIEAKMLLLPYTKEEKVAAKKANADCIAAEDQVMRGIVDDGWKQAIAANIKAGCNPWPRYRQVEAFQ